MENKDARIFVASVGNVSKRLDYYGDANIEKVSLLKLIYKYACYSSTYSQLQRLDCMVAELQRTDPFICLEQQANASSDYVPPIGVVEIGVEAGNQPPTLQDSSIVLGDSDYEHIFTYEDLFSGYADDAQGLPSSFVITALPSQGGELLYNGQELLPNTVLYDITLLTYVRSADNLGYSDLFLYIAYDDDSQLPLPSNVATCSVTVQAIVIPNQPPTVGDRNQYVQNRTTTVFTVADFTSNASPAYSDPENNPLDAIRIDVISDANDGILYFLGSPVQIGQIITSAQLSAGAFYHVGPDENTINSDSFELSVRDTVNGTWVQ